MDAKPATRKLGKYPFYSIAIILFFLTHGYSENIGLVPFYDMLVFFVIASLVAFVILIGLGKNMRSLTKAGIMTSVLLFFYLFYGAIQDSLKNAHVLHPLSTYRVLLPGIVVLLVGLFYYLKKSRHGFGRITVYFNTLLIVLILADVIKIASHSSNENSGSLPAFQPCDTCAKPDIYLIVMDEYWGTDMLQQYYGYDNHSFITFLSGNGFHVLQHPSSNYLVTPISMAATLDMQYAEWLHGRKHEAEGDYALVASKKITNSTTIQWLKSMGYKINNYSIFDILSQPAPFTFESIPIKLQLITSKTFPARIKKDLVGNSHEKKDSEFNWLAQKIQDKFKKVNSEIIRLTNESTNKNDDQPHFTYTHLLMPHVPYLYDSLGRDIFLDYYQTAISGKKNDAAYLQYLVYTNKVVEELIANIMRKSGRQAVIILMSDHGNRFFEHPDSTLSKSNSFNAIYFPSKNYELFYDSMSNVNQFRVIFNSLFHQKLPLLKDSLVF